VIIPTPSCWKISLTRSESLPTHRHLPVPYERRSKRTRGKQRALYEALRKAGVPAEMHLYEHGKHGVGLASADPILSTWRRASPIGCALAALCADAVQAILFL